MPIIFKKKHLVLFFSRKTALTRFLCSAFFLTKFWFMYFCVISLSILIWGCCYIVGLCQHTWSTMVTVLLQRPLLRVQGSLLQRRWHPSKTDKVSLNLSTENRRKKWYMCSVYLLPFGNVFYINPPQTGAMLHILKYLTRGASIFFCKQSLYFSMYSLNLWFWKQRMDGESRMYDQKKHIRVLTCVSVLCPPFSLPPKVKWRPAYWLNN